MNPALVIACLIVVIPMGVATVVIEKDKSALPYKSQEPLVARWFSAVFCILLLAAGSVLLEIIAPVGCLLQVTGVVGYFLYIHRSTQRPPDLDSILDQLDLP